MENKPRRAGHVPTEDKRRTLSVLKVENVYTPLEHTHWLTTDMDHKRKYDCMNFELLG
jgi:hypothetical protein